VLSAVLALLNLRGLMGEADFWMGHPGKSCKALASVGDKDIVFRLEGVTKVSHLL
jgi:hypothetical protein